MFSLPSAREFLLEELYNRQQKNSAYSLRAFARDTGLSPAFASQVMKGQRSLSEERGRRVAEVLGWKGKKYESFLKILRLEQLENPVEILNLQKEISEILKKQAIPVFDIKEHHFKSISDWYHFAIAELTALKEFREEPDWIATRLGITSLEARQALARLQTLGLLERQKGRLVRANGHYEVQETPAQSIRNFHKQMLKKAERSLSQQAVDQREFRGTTLTVSEDQLHLAKKLIKEFTEKFDHVIAAQAPRENAKIYHLAVQFFSVENLTKTPVALPNGENNS